MQQRRARDRARGGDLSSVLPCERQPKISCTSSSCTKELFKFIQRAFQVGRPQIDPPRSNTYRQLSRQDSPWIDLPRRFPQSQGLQDYRVCSCRAGSDAKTSRQSLLEPRAWKSRYNLGSAPRYTAGSLEAWRSPARARVLRAWWFPAAGLRLRASARGTALRVGKPSPNASCPLLDPAGPVHESGSSMPAGRWL